MSMLNDREHSAARVLQQMETIAQFDRVSDILTHTHDVLFSFGAVRTSYHFTPPFGSQKGRNVYISSTNFPESWMELYRDPDFRQHDPVSDFIMERGEICIIEEAIAVQDLTDGQATFVEKLRSERLNHGFGVPLYGPNGRNGYATVGFDRPLDIVHDAELALLVSASCNASFRRVSQLTLERVKEGISLSKREQDVLDAMCTGRSNRQIAEKIAISQATVDTYVRRLFVKLDVNDRTHAILKALTLRLATINLPE
jgi:DNA-binding CsgD family transcriptional regulator